MNQYAIKKYLQMANILQLQTPLFQYKFYTQYVNTNILPIKKNKCDIAIFSSVNSSEILNY